MELQLFNSLQNRITKLNLQSNQAINIYLCGPTVYDHIHIGNLRSVIIFDILHRLLLCLKVKVNYVQNITDIDDKIILKAQQEQKSEKEISDYYTQTYWANLVRYNILFPTHSPRVTNYLSPVQEFIKGLLKKGFAYYSAGEVFFGVEKNPEYGKLSGQILTKLKSGSEVAAENKKNEKDFVLWKKTTKGITWNSPWGAGRPGWHTECSVFINELFRRQTIDIHGGGNDLLFPHHENERIQYLAYNDKELSNIWLHVAHIHWKSEKMSKSLGNVILAEHFAQKYGVNALRYLILNSPYNQVINLSKELIQQAVDYTQKIKNLLKKLNFCLYIEKIKIIERETQKRKEVIDSLLNNLNTIKVLYLGEEIITFLNKSIDKKATNNTKFLEATGDFYFVLNTLGFKFNLPTYDLETRLLIKKWQDLREKGDYIPADQIRRQLQEKGIL